MKRALVKIVDSVNYCYPSWVAGLTSCGYTIVKNIDTPTKDDVLVIWNRYGREESNVQRFQKVGAKVLVAENGYLGKTWNNNKWFAISLNHHNGAGTFPKHLGESRKQLHGFKLQPWRQTGQEIVFLPQRGYGEPGVAMPNNWKPNFVCRERAHPGPKESITLEDDINTAKAVVTWGSGAAVKAMAMGIPVIHGFDNWIAKEGSTHIKDVDLNNIAKPDREQAFNCVFAAMWTEDEVKNGLPFRELL